LSIYVIRCTGPAGVAYDSSNGYVYVANAGSKSVSVISGATNKVIANIAVGSAPDGVVYDPSNGYVYVANSNSSTVSVISTSPQVIKIYTVIFMESGLPSGASWSVTLTGRTFNGQHIDVTLSSTTNTITFNEPNGTYSYIIHLPSGYQNSVKGQVNVSGNSAIATIKAQQIIKPQQTTNYLSIGIIAVVIIIVILLAVAFLIRNRNKQRVAKQKEPPKEK
jgi:YVTN family beta-propeller protein